MDSEKYYIGQSAEFSKTISESDVYGFAGITGDFNPLHVNAEKAKDMFFGKRIVHGMLTASFISTVIAGQLPGPGTIYMGQELHFLKPVFYNDTITAKVQIKEIDSKGHATLLTTVTNQDGVTVVDGEAFVKLPKENV